MWYLGNGRHRFRPVDLPRLSGATGPASSPMSARGDEQAVAASQQPALEVRGVRKSFAGVLVLHDVDLVVRSSSVHALVGHNGSGKSTLIKALAGFHAPDTSVSGTSFGQPFLLGDHASAAKRPACASCIRISASLNS